jgi:hypothetical protein
VGLNISNSRAQFIGFLGASAARLIWNGLQLAPVDIMHQRGENLPGSLKTNMYMVRANGYREVPVGKQNST